MYSRELKTASNSTAVLLFICVFQIPLLYSHTPLHLTGMENFYCEKLDERKRETIEEEKKDEADLLTLSLWSNHSVVEMEKETHPQPKHVNISPLLVPYTASTYLNPNHTSQVVTPRRVRNRRGPAQVKSDTILPPFPWATDRRAFVYSYNYLVQNKILTIAGTVQCKRCEKKFDMHFNLDEKLAEVWRFIQKNMDTMHNRAPRVWVDPVLPKCQYCGQENSVRPFLADTKKKEINWLFLLLGQMLGCCTLEQLKYFCKHTSSHRTGAKDRLLYSTYMGLCQQLFPECI